MTTYHGIRTYWMGPLRITRKIKGLKVSNQPSQGEDQIYTDLRGRKWLARGLAPTDDTDIGELRRIFA